ncbi:hypothetical protein [Flagellimonas aequoris]|uniref:Uncharacterized protein n=1 Tax=Flagellimonas aequoris TaxID=2306997 RepID=A0A418N6W3_9FLAO|nr:hypothetical protein [Allomuricauda aequoris]RIV70618.1 hypothetical protein D2U88_09630 [Allomuricauda aequoris]TXK02053.1 hypothetical protein FQ019_09555 [Allomuricauda aequoris]
MGIFSFLKRKQHNNLIGKYENYVLERKLLSVHCFAPFSNMFSDYHIFQTEKMMKVWDTFFPIAMCGYCSTLDNIINESNEYDSLKQTVRSQFIKGDEIFDDYRSFIDTKNKKIGDTSQLTSLWFSKNFQVYGTEEQRRVANDLKFLNIINLFLKSAYNDKDANFPNYISTTFNGDLKTESGITQYIRLMELYCKKTFGLIKEMLEH